MHLCNSNAYGTGVLRWAAVALGLGALVVPGHARAQQPGTGAVRGYVIEAETNTPVRSATVVLIPLPPSEGTVGSVHARQSTVYTDDRGEYAFRGVQPGRYRIDVSGLGYHSRQVWIDLPTSCLVQRSVALEVKPIQLDPVEIVLSPPESRVAGELIPLQRGGARVPGRATAAAHPVLYGLDVRTLDPTDLPANGALGEPDVFRALERFPGVSTRGDFSANLWTRGSPWGTTAVLLDGLPLYDPLHLGGIAAGVAADGLRSIALMPGVRPPSEAEGAAGTIALTTRPAEKRGAVVGLSSLAVRTRVEDRVLDDRVGVSVTARRSWWDLLSPPAFLASPQSRGPMDYHFTDVLGRVDARLGSAGVLEGGGLWEEDRLHGGIADVVSASDGHWGNRAGWLKLTRPVGGLRVETRLGKVAYRVGTGPLPWYSFLGPKGVPSLDQTETVIDHTSLETSVHGRDDSGRVRWDAGVDLVRERLAQQGVDATDGGLPGVDAPARLSRLRAWTQATVSMGAFEVAGGVSLNQASGDAPAPFALPSVRVRWSPVSWLAVEGARGKSIQFIYPLAPTGGSLGPALGTGYTWIIAGDGRPPLVSDISTLTADVSLPGGVFAQLVRWTRGMDGLWLSGVYRLSDGMRVPVARRDNVFGGERGRGLEGRLGWRNHRLDVEAGYSMGRSRFQDSTSASWPSPAERRHSLDLHLQAYVTRTVDVGLDYTSESGWPLVLGPATPCGDDQSAACIDFSDPDSLPQRYSFADAPRYESLSLRLRWTHQWEHVGLDLIGSVENVFGRVNAEAFRAGTCVGADLFSSVCEQSLGLPSFSPGLTRPTPTIAATVRF